MAPRITFPWQRAAEDDETPHARVPSLDIETASETELLAAARAGNEAAFAALVCAHQGEIFRLARRMVRDEDEAADITQDVFLAAWRGLEAFRGDAQMGTWLYRITYHCCLKAIESKRQQAAELAQLASAQVERLASAWSAMQATLAEQQWCQAIQEQISRLPEKYRTILCLRHMEGMSYKEIAQEQTIPISSVKTHLFRAREMLAERLQQIETDAQSTGAALNERLQFLAASVGGALLRGHVVLQGE